MKALFFILLLVVSSVFASPLEDLVGGNVVNEGICAVDGGVKTPCVLVEKDEVLYLVLYDKRGESHLYRLDGDKWVLIWSRNMV